MGGKLNYIKNYIYMVCIILVLIGGLNWGLVGIFDFNLVTKISYYPMIEKVIYMLVGIAALVLIVNRDTYLPFLGETVYPAPVNDIAPVIRSTPIAISLKNLPSNTKVVYWAALPLSLTHPADYIYSNPDEAYGDYSNSGVGTSDDNGILVVKINNPARYKVGFKGTLDAHLHYRYWKQNDLLSKVYTLKVAM